MRAPLWCAIALSERIHPARAVVPPPRLRAKWVVFSAPLRTTPGGSGWALAWRCGEVGSLRNPAPRGYFFERSGGVAVQVEGGISKRVISVTSFG